MHVTAPGSTCSIASRWKSIQKSYGSSKLFFLSIARATNICSAYGGPMGLSVHAAQRMVGGRQGTAKWFAVDADLEQP